MREKMFSVLFFSHSGHFVFQKENLPSPKWTLMARIENLLTSENFRGGKKPFGSSGYKTLPSCLPVFQHCRINLPQVWGLQKNKLEDDSFGNQSQTSHFPLRGWSFFSRFKAGNWNTLQFLRCPLGTKEIQFSHIAYFLVQKEGGCAIPVVPRASGWFTGAFWTN